MRVLNTIGSIFVFLIILLVAVGCFYLITKQSPVITFVAQITQDNNIQEDIKKTIVFTGDIMLDRGVEYKIKQNNNDYLYPFEKVKDFFQKFDIVVGNLEGPIVENAPDFSGTSLRFAFNKESAKALSLVGFNVMSLANNHTDNMLWQGIYETRNFLSEQDIDYVGEPNGCTQDFVLEKQGVLFLAFNKTYIGNCPNSKIAEAVRTTRTNNQEQLLIVSLHWGEEYKLTASSYQQDLAHQLIDAGADLIIGHHPHVVQNIEIYNNKMIFYSLGNFVFDQDFSKPTKEGLMVGVEIFQDKLVYRLYPVFIEKAQPFLMDSKEKKQLLKEIAERSSEELTNKIKAGRISIVKNR